MRRFEYVQPVSVQEAVSVLEREGEDALVLAGGTALVIMLAQGLIRPRYVVDLGGIPELQGIRTLDDGGVRIGALTKVRALERGVRELAGHTPLAEAASQVASVRVRNAATVGGSVCYGEPQTDVPPALIALGGAAVAHGPGGSRRIELERFYAGPYETVLEPGELVGEVALPPQPANSGGCHVKFTIGPSENKPVVNVSVALSVDAATRKCNGARIVMGAVGPTPLLVTEASALLEGALPNDAAIAEAARLASEQAEPVDDLRGSAWYKRRIVRVLVERAVRCAMERAWSGQA